MGPTWHLTTAERWPWSFCHSDDPPHPAQRLMTTPDQLDRLRQTGAPTCRHCVSIADAVTAMHDAHRAAVAAWEAAT